MNLENKVFHLMKQKVNPDKRSFSARVMEKILHNFKFDSNTGFFSAKLEDLIFESDVKGKIKENEIRFYDIRSDNKIGLKFDSGPFKDCCHVAKHLFMGQFSEINNFIEIEATCDYIGKFSEDSLYDEKIVGNILPEYYTFMREIKDSKFNPTECFNKQSGFINDYDGISDTIEKFDEKFNLWISGPGKKYEEQHILNDAREKKMMKEWFESSKQDAISTCTLYFPKQYVDNANKDITHPIAAEKYIFEKVKPKLFNEKFDFGDRELPLYCLSDEETKFVSDFLGCDPNYSEHCYSVLKYLDSRNRDKTPLGFSSHDLRDMIFFAADSAKNMLL